MHVRTFIYVFLIIGLIGSTGTSVYYTFQTLRLTPEIHKAETVNIDKHEANATPTEE